MLDAFADGVFFVPLGSIRDPSLVISATAQGLSVRDAAGRPLLDSLKDHLRERALLLVLDNFEHVLAAAPVVADLLAACAQLKVLVTSRAVLHLSGEHDFPVPPLALPDPKHLPPLEQLTQYGAVRLFVERAAAVRPEFRLTDENAPVVAEICHRLDGLPLAIELAAARVRLLPPRALLARLDHRLPLLTGGARDLPTRQQTLRNTIAWSYDLLSPEAQTLFRRLAVFSGGCAVEAAEAVVSDDDAGRVDAPQAPRAGSWALSASPHARVSASDVLDGLESLADQSLLWRDEAEGELRLGMLETVREFALEQLEASGEAGAVRRRHAGYLASFAAVATDNLRGPGQLIWLRSLEREQDNLRAALAWSLATGEGQLALQLTGALHWFWMLRLPGEGRVWLDRALALGAAQGLQQTPDGFAALLAQADLAWAARDPDLPQLLEGGAAACAAARDARGSAWFQHVRGERASMFGDAAHAAQLLEASVAGFRAQGDIWDMARALLDLAHVVDRRGERGRARALLEECLAHFRELGDRWGITQALAALAFHTVVEGEHERAARLAEASLTPARELSDVRSIAQSLSLVGWLAHLRGDGDAAHARLQEALGLGRDTGNQYAVARVFTVVGERVRAQQHYAWAAVLYEHGLALFREIGADEAARTNLQNLGWAVLRLGDPARAAVLFRESFARPFDRHAANGLAGMAGVALARGRPERAARRSPSRGPGWSRHPGRARGR
jgi:predicted ATPase